ncbi:AraC family transcriptional regulator [Paenibacillus sp. GCM10023252]|uniref:AraC family transcriptional regulator n=1 Tax=Paenibacillus sp. GCM10023252 TaxID=3252649 RepID=UPI00361C7F3E
MTYYRYQEFMKDEFPFKVEVKDQAKLRSNEPHAHEYFQICYVLRGTCLHHVSDSTVTLVKGDLFSIPPGYVHRVELLEEAEIQIVHMDFMPHLLDHSLHGLTNMDSFINFAFIQPFAAMNDRMLPKLNLSHSGQAAVEVLITEMLEELKRQADGYTLIVKASMQKLLVIAGREYADFLDHKAEGHRAQTNRRYFDQAVDYVRENYHQEIKLQDAAAVAAMSPSYFSTMFKLIVGKSFIEFVNDTRLQEALRLLKETDERIENIAYQVGYNQLTHFHRMFRKIIGITPSEYRKQCSASELE